MRSDYTHDDEMHLSITPFIHLYICLPEVSRGLFCLKVTALSNTDVTVTVGFVLN